MDWTDPSVPLGLFCTRSWTKGLTAGPRSVYPSCPDLGTCSLDRFGYPRLRVDYAQCTVGIGEPPHSGGCVGRGVVHVQVVFLHGGCHCWRKSGKEKQWQACTSPRSGQGIKYRVEALTHAMPFVFPFGVGSKWPHCLNALRAVVGSRLPHCS